MATDILNLFVYAFNAASSWFTSIFHRSGMISVYLGVIAISLMVRFILLPLFGGAGSGAGSDKVKHSKEDS